MDFRLSTFLLSPKDLVVFLVARILVDKLEIFSSWQLLEGGVPATLIL